MKFNWITHTTLDRYGDWSTQYVAVAVYQTVTGSVRLFYRDEYGFAHWVNLETIGL